MVRKENTLIPVLAGIGMAFIWGFSFLFTKGALEYTTPLQLLSFRFGVAALVLTLLKLVGLIPIHFKGKDWRALLPLSFFQPGLYFIGETWGVKWTSASEAGMIIALVPVVVAIMARIFLKEKLHPLQVVAILASVLGVLVIVLGQGSVEVGEHLWGLVALFLAVISAGAYSILSKKSSVDFNPWEITFIMMWSGTVIFNGLGMAQSLWSASITEFWQPLGIGSVQGAVLYLGTLSSIGAFFLFNYMISRLSVARTAPFTNLVTLVSVLAGVIFLGEPFSWQVGIGVVLILFGVWGTNVFYKPRPFNLKAKRLE
jgi:drug/metabolite transporter (DMT)-like permease